MNIYIIVARTEHFFAWPSIEVKKDDQFKISLGDLSGHNTKFSEEAKKDIVKQLKGTKIFFGHKNIVGEILSAQLNEDGTIECTCDRKPAKNSKHGIIGNITEWSDNIVRSFEVGGVGCFTVSSEIKEKKNGN